MRGAPSQRREAAWEGRPLPPLPQTVGGAAAAAAAEGGGGVRAAGGFVPARRRLRRRLRLRRRRLRSEVTGGRRVRGVRSDPGAPGPPRCRERRAGGG